MAAIQTTDFDLGPLSWVKTEIDHSLNQARENLDKLAAELRSSVAGFKV